MIEFSYNVNNVYASSGICMALSKITEQKSDICFVFVGTDSNIGDSLGPLVGSMLNIKNGNIFTYGDLKNTITARDVPHICNFVANAHPNSFCIVVDAAVGDKNDIGLIKVRQEGLKPGLGVNKDLPLIGNAAIIGVISEKTQFSNVSLGLARLRDVHKMAETIANGIESFVNMRYRPFKIVSK